MLNYAFKGIWDCRHIKDKAELRRRCKLTFKFVESGSLPCPADDLAE